jgi:hypothetical protein
MIFTSVYDLQAMPSTRHWKSSAPRWAGAAAAPLLRQLQLLVALLLLLACSTRATYGCKFFSGARSSAAAASSAVPVGVTSTTSMAVATSGLHRPTLRPSVGTVTSRWFQSVLSSQAQHAKTKATWRKLVKEAAGELVKDEIQQALEQQFADVTCQAWCQIHCTSPTRQGPSCINAAGELSSMPASVLTENEDNKRACEEFCQPRV